MHFIKKYNIPHFKGIFMRDSLPFGPSKTDVLESGIMNLDVSSGSGTHWTCWFKRGLQDHIAQERKHLKGAQGRKHLKPVCYYFDSFGLSPPVEFENYMNCDIYHSTYQIQKLGDVICGHLCILVLYMMTVCNIPFHEILLLLIKDEC